MGHSTSGKTLNPTERDFEDAMQHGDDFFKIELLRQAKKWYLKALDLNLETDRVKHQIAECDKLIAYERKIVSILGVIASVIVLVYVISCI